MTDIPPQSINTSLGVALALTVAVFWGLSPFAHAAAGRRISAFHALLWRSALGSAILLAILAVSRVSVPPLRASLVMAASGVVGVGIGDFVIFDALVQLGPRRTVQLLALGPVFTFLLAWIFLGETVSPVQFGGAALVLLASFTAIWVESRRDPASREPGRVSLRGISGALGGAIAIGAASVIARQAYRMDPGMHPIAASCLRVVSASMVLWLMPAVWGGYPVLMRSLTDRRAVVWVAFGTALGPVLGMLAFVGAIKHLEAGLVTALMSLSPLLILPVSAWRHRVRIGPAVILAAVAAVTGVALIALGRR
ncbi:MAG: DMT family transporter [Candidatus Coatesbacteria bacterium]